MQVHLKKNIKPRVLNGHPWIYDNEIEKAEGDVAPGSFVRVFYKNTFLGTGYYNESSVIRVRLVSRQDVPVNREFWEKKLRSAFSYRKFLFPNSQTYRLVFGEADGIPGFIVDKFSDYIAIQVNTIGIYNIKETLVDIIKKELNPKGIFEKDDDASAKKEGFVPVDGWIFGNGPELIPFEINNIKFFADTLGQKTGFFLDQRINALENMKYSKNAKVLDAFTYTGNFGVHSLAGGASHVTFMDYSSRALNVLTEVLKENKFDSKRFTLINCNSFDQLRKFDDEGIQFDLTVIDPPSMTKSKETKSNALKGYKELNLRAMKLTKNGGLLSTSSCTQLVYDSEFTSVIRSAAEDTRKQITMVYKGMQSPDHPNILNVLETEYLKHYLLRVNDIKGV